MDPNRLQEITRIVSQIQYLHGLLDLKRDLNNVEVLSKEQKNRLGQINYEITIGSHLLDTRFMAGLLAELVNLLQGDTTNALV